MSLRTYPELGKSNLLRCITANGIDPQVVDLESLYDDHLTPGENIQMVTAALGIRTSREERALLQAWEAMCHDG